MMPVANDPIVRVAAVTTTPDLAALAALSRRPRRSPLPTWAELVEREPRLADLLDEIRTLPHDDPHWCGVRAWFGPRYRGDGIKAHMVALVGWHAERDDPVLRTDLAYRVLYDALPPCNDCPCGAVGRALFGVERPP
jgi:hypothetical protein